MKIDSLDPRVKRAGLEDNQQFTNLEAMDQWQTYEVFAQVKRGTHHQHVGSVHAPDPELALIFAKEQFARRGVCVNIWVAKTADVYATSYEDADMFDLIQDKKHRDPDNYKVMDRIKAYKERTKEGV